MDKFREISQSITTVWIAMSPAGDCSLADEIDCVFSNEKAAVDYIIKNYFKGNSYYEKLDKPTLYKKALEYIHVFVVDAYTRAYNKDCIGHQPFNHNP